jgi:hypothetical protein
MHTASTAARMEDGDDASDMSPMSNSGSVALYGSKITYIDVLQNDLLLFEKDLMGMTLESLFKMPPHMIFPLNIRFLRLGKMQGVFDEREL